MAAPATQDLLNRLEPLGMRLDLAPFRLLLERLGHPERAVPSVLIGGTNGKGSCAVLLAAAGCAAGYRVGLYTSPHLEDPAERIRVDGECLADPELHSLLKRVLAAAPEPPTYFEALTAAALLGFARQGVDLAVLEVGMGGRLDATNATEPLVSVITDVARDHQRYLGSTLAAIAGEKAGILRADRPALVWGRRPDVARALEEAARRVGARLQRVDREVVVHELDPDRDGRRRVRVDSRTRSCTLVFPWLGAHQRSNLALAVAAAEALAGGGFPRLDAQAIGRGVASCRWPGRLEEVPAPGGVILLDGAHNPAAVERLVEHLRERGEPPDVLFGALDDKDYPAMLSQLAPVVRRMVLTAPASPRAVAPSELVRHLLGRDEVETATLEEGLDRALAAAPRFLLVTGSFYLVGAIRPQLRERFGAPAAARSPLFVL